MQALQGTGNLPGPRVVAAARGLLGKVGRMGKLDAVGEAAWGTRLACGRFCAAGAAAAGAGLLGELVGSEGAGVTAGEAEAAGMSYF